MPRQNPRLVSIGALADLWERYTEWQTKQLSPSTISRDYAKITRRINLIPKSLRNSADVAEWLNARYSPETARRTLQQFRACYAWAVAADKTDRNPWDVLPRLRSTKGSTRYKAFTQADRDRITAEFRRQYPEDAPWVEFLFLAGCRPSEAAGLLWGNISSDCSRIRIDAAFPIDVAIQQSTKTHKQREFQCGTKLRALLKSLRPPHPSPSARVFCGPKGGPYNYANFQTRKWKPLVQALVKSGEVSCYLPQKNTRHTKATQLLRDGYNAKDASVLLGNTPSVFLSAYADQARELEMKD